MSKENCYEVYVCRVDGEIVYIGSGRHGRHKHCDSGCSHVYELNKIHFLADDAITVIATGPLTSDALAEKIHSLNGGDGFYFYDAAAPIIEKESIDFSKAYVNIGNIR